MDQSWQTFQHVIGYNNVIVCSILYILHNIVQPGKLFLSIFIISHHPVYTHELFLVIQMLIKDLINIFVYHFLDIFSDLAEVFLCSVHISFQVSNLEPNIFSILIYALKYLVEPFRKLGVLCIEQMMLLGHLFLLSIHARGNFINFFFNFAYLHTSSTNFIRINSILIAIYSLRLF